MKTTKQYLMRLLFVLTAVFCLTTVHAQQQGQSAIFNYCKDGDFNMFLNSEVDSIIYSNIGLDNIEYDNVVVQEVWTPDSVYRIPIENIDSIGFHAPQPRYSEDTFPIMDELLPFIVEVDELSITFSPTTPEDKLPLIGQVMVADSWEAPLQDGFAGRVIERRQTGNGILFQCEEVSLSDIFESLVLVTRCTTSENAVPRNLLPRRSWWDRDIEIPEDEVTIPLLGFKIGGDEESPLSFNYDPSLTIKYEFYVVQGQPARAHLTFNFKHDFTLEGSHSIEIPKDNGSHEWLGKQIPIPIPAVSNIVRPYVQFGAFLDAKAKAEFNFTLPVFLEHTFGLDYNEERGDDAVQFINDINSGVDNENANIALKLDGSMATGLAIVIGAKIIHKRLLSVEGHFHIGPMMKGKLELDANNIAEEATLYRLLKDTDVELDTYLSVNGTFRVWGRQVQLTKRGTWKGAKWKGLDDTLIEGSLEYTSPIFKWYLLPDFDKPFVWKSTSQSAWCMLYPKRELLWPVDLGVTFTEYGTDNVIEKDYGSYHSQKTMQGENMSYMGYTDVIDGLKENTIYKVTPTVTLWGVKMNAVPTTDYGSSTEIFASPSQVEMEIGATTEVSILGGSGDYEVDDGDGSIVRSVKLTPVKNQKKATLFIYGVKAGNAVITVTDRQNPTCRVNINVTVKTDEVTTTYTVNGVSFKMVKVSGGTFQMGATEKQEDDVGDDLPVHSVTLSDYYIGETEVTQALWYAVMGQRPWYDIYDDDIYDDPEWEIPIYGDNYPADCLSWFDCQEFITRLNQLTGMTFRLPTEAEWEFAARGGNNSLGYKYAGSNTIDQVAWYCDNADDIQPVATKAPNELGFYDMSGNVSEWCQDGYFYDFYSESPQTNPVAEFNNAECVTRGGSCGSGAWFCGVSDRDRCYPSARCQGLRLAQ